MIQFARFVLSNGLRVLVHEDASTPMAVVNVLYDVGARDEDPRRTGFAHLFEHLMFGGSINIAEYDDELQRQAVKTMHIPPTTSPIITASCLPKTWRPLSGSKVTGCYHWPSAKKAWKYSAKWLARSLRNIISTNLTVMYGISSGNLPIPFILTAG